MTTRKAIAEDLAAYLKNLGLDDVYGININLITPATPKGKSYFNVTFCQAGTLDGVIKIYGSTFILINYTTAIRHLPQHGNFKFDSVDAVKVYLLSNFGSNS